MLSKMKRIPRPPSSSSTTSSQGLTPSHLSRRQGWRQTPHLRLCCRGYALQSGSGAGIPAIFNRHVKQLQRTRAAMDVEGNREADYLKDEIARRVVDRLLFLKREFPVVVDLGGGNGHIARALMGGGTSGGSDNRVHAGTGTNADTNAGTNADTGAGGVTNTGVDAEADARALRSRIGVLRVTDLALPLAERDSLDTYASPRSSHSIAGAGTGPGAETDVAKETATGSNDREGARETGLNVTREYADEESLGFADDSIDAVVSNLSLHWVNDLPGTLSQIHRCLRPDAPFLATMFGGDTLFELRTALQLADSNVHGGFAPRVSPMTNVKDVGSLLNRAGYKLTTVDVDDVVVMYPDIFALMADLHRMGESNAIWARPGGPVSRDTLIAAAEIYKALHGVDGETGIPATFQVLYMIGWKPGQGTPEPQARGTGQASLKETLEGFRKPGDGAHAKQVKVDDQALSGKTKKK